MARSWLRHTGYDVTLVHNITDVDDKVYAEAERQGIPSRRLSEQATAWFLEDTDELGLGRPDVEPRATETIPEIVEFIEELVVREQAYVANGDVYFSVARFPEYGQLSGARLEDMVAQETSELKRDQRDFALWKSQKEHEDAAWDSPWGRVGRAGTSSARRWPRSSSALRSRSTVAGSTSASRTTRTSSRSRGASATSSRGSGCTTACSS